MPTIGGCVKGKHVGIIVVLAIVIIAAVAWRNDKLNKYLPEKLRHKNPNVSGFIGLTRSGIYVMGPGGRPGMPGIDLNTSDWV
jgi:hypothetical protein